MIDIEEPVQKTSSRSSNVFRVYLSELQAGQFRQALAGAKELTEVSGIFCTLRNTLDLENGRLALELQVARLDRCATRKIQAILAKTFEPDHEALVAKKDDSK